MTDIEQQLAMRRILAFARKEMPESIFCFISFSDVEIAGEWYCTNKIISNTEDRVQLVANAARVLQGFLTAEVNDLRDVQGGMQ